MEVTSGKTPGHSGFEFSPTVPQEAQGSQILRLLAGRAASMVHALTRQPWPLQDAVSALLEQTAVELEKRQEGRSGSQALEDSW